MFRKQPLYLLLALALATVSILLVQGARTQEKARAHFRWEYRVQEYGASECSGNSLQSSLNSLGDQGWEMTGMTPIANGESQIVLQTASLGYGKEVVPNLTDSWQGVISPTSEPGCRMVFRRPSY